MFFLVPFDCIELGPSPPILRAVISAFHNVPALRIADCTHRLHKIVRRIQVVSFHSVLRRVADENQGASFAYVPDVPRGLNSLSAVLTNQRDIRNRRSDVFVWQISRPKRTDCDRRISPIKIAFDMANHHVPFRYIVVINGDKQSIPPRTIIIICTIKQKRSDS